MDAELKALEAKISQFIEMCARLRADNQQLRQQLASAVNQSKRLEEKITSAASAARNAARADTFRRGRMSEARSLQITIMGRDFRVACPEDEQSGLLEAVDYLNKKMIEIRDTGKVIGLERIAIMAALNIALELLSTKVGGFDMGEIKRRMTRMETVIDQAMSEQANCSDPA